MGTDSDTPPLRDDRETADLERDERIEARRQRRARSWWQRRRVEPEERDRVLGELFAEADRWRPFVYRSTFLQVMSVTVAVVGITADSAALVIGAMLLSPLMIPVVAVSAALVMVWPRRLVSALAVVAVASAGSMALAWLLSTLIPDPLVGRLPAELLARTRPTLLDLVVALAAGAAGAYSLVREEVGRALPGVAVAVALVPPLAAVGIAVDIGRYDLARGALLLYLTNLAAIVLAGGVVFLATGFIPTVRVARLSRQVATALVAALLPVAVLAVPLSRTLREGLREAELVGVVRAEIPSWLQGRDLDLLDVRVEGGLVVVELAGSDRAPPAGQLADRVSGRVGHEVGVRVVTTSRTVDVSVPGG